MRHPLKMINITCSSISSAFATQVRIIILKIISFLIYKMSQNIKRIVPTTSASYNRLCSPYIFPLFNLSSSLFSYLSTPHHIVLNTLLLLLGLLPSLRGPCLVLPAWPISHNNNYNNKNITEGFPFFFFFLATATKTF